MDWESCHVQILCIRNAADFCAIIPHTVHFNNSGIRASPISLSVGRDICHMTRGGPDGFERDVGGEPAVCCSQGSIEPCGYVSMYFGHCGRC